MKQQCVPSCITCRHYTTWFAERPVTCGRNDPFLGGFGTKELHKKLPRERRRSWFMDRCGPEGKYHRLSTDRDTT